MNDARLLMVILLTHLEYTHRTNDNNKQLRNKFGFSASSTHNMFDHLMVQLDSKASRSSPTAALLSLHSQYIGGPNANYRLW